MFISTRYLFRQLFFTTTFLLILFSLTIWLSQSLRFIEYVVQKGLKLTTLFFLATLALPEIIAVLLPFCFLIAVVFVYSKAESDHELIILRAVGASPFRLARAVIYSGLLFSLLLGSFTLYIIPKSLEQFHDLTHNIKNQAPSFYIQDRQFLSFGRITVYVREAINGKKLKGLLIHDNKPQNPSILVAEQGEVMRVRDKIHLTLYNGQRFETDNKTGKPIILRFDQYDVNINEPEGPKGDAKQSVHQLATFDLLDYDDQTFSMSRKISEFHKRVMTPFLVLLFGLSALAILLSGDYHRKGSNRKIIGAFVASLLMQILVMMLLNAIKRNEVYIYVTYLTVSGLFVASFYLLINPFARIPYRVKS